jgi:hypothetical protein
VYTTWLPTAGAGLDAVRVTDRSAAGAEVGLGVGLVGALDGARVAPGTVGDSVAGDALGCPVGDTVGDTDTGTTTAVAWSSSEGTLLFGALSTSGSALVFTCVSRSCEPEGSTMAVMLRATLPPAGTLPTVQTPVALSYEPGPADDTKV